MYHTIRKTAFLWLKKMGGGGQQFSFGYFEELEIRIKIQILEKLRVEVLKRGQSLNTYGLNTT